MAHNETPDGEATADSREQGVEFGQLADDLHSHDYPATRREIVDEYGDRELDVADGSQRLEEVLVGRREGDEETYGNAGEVQQAVLNMIGEEAVGRADYSDRGGDSMDEATEGEPNDDQSL